MSYIGPVTRDIIDACIKEIKKRENKEKINKYILDPIIEEVLYKSYPYALIHAILQLIIVVLLIYVISKISSIKT
jgi:hypothetical protein